MANEIVETVKGFGRFMRKPTLANWRLQKQIAKERRAARKAAKAGKLGRVEDIDRRVENFSLGLGNMNDEGAGEGSSAFDIDGRYQ